MSNKIHIILERFWLVVASLAALSTLYYYIQDGSEGILYFLIITGLAWVMFFMRRGIRKRYEKIAEEKNTAKSKKKPSDKGKSKKNKNS